jgi:hypothetical protein
MGLLHPFGERAGELLGVGAGNRTLTISLGIGAFRAPMCPELRSWLSASDHDTPVFTGLMTNGTAASGTSYLSSKASRDAYAQLPLEFAP